LYVLFICFTLLVPSLGVYATEIEGEKPAVEDESVEIENGDIHYLTEVMKRGAKKPSSKASTHNLDVSDYNYQLENFGYKVFTDKWVTSTSGEITVYLDSFSLITSYMGDSNKITFNLYDSSGKLVTSNKTVNSRGTAYVTWINIKSDKKYYISFEVPKNGNRYTGHGNITN
jgi:hypothetical protein